MDREGLSSEARAWALRFGEGSPGKVKEAIETGIVGWTQPVEGMLRDLVSGRYPVQMGSELASMVDSWAAARADADKRVSKDASNRAGFDRMLSLIGELLREQLAHAAQSGDAMGAEITTARIDVLEKARQRLGANVPMLMVFEAMAGELAQPSMLSGV